MSLPSPHRLRRAASILAAGGVLTHPTDGVWGLSADAMNAQAVFRVLAAKQRDVARGLIVIAADPSHLAPLIDPDADQAWQRAVDSWPSATTWLVPARADAPWWLTGAHHTIAVREPAHALTRALASEFGGPIVSTSANVTGHPPVRSTWQARARFGKRVDFVLGGECDTPGQPSTIRDANSGEILRGR